jgi:hypothetical protein
LREFASERSGHARHFYFLEALWLAGLLFAFLFARRLVSAPLSKADATAFLVLSN